ncbi:unnamed protein product [Cunninghamella echinulata]
MGTITLYEGNNATQNIVATYNDGDHSGKVNPNDEARSMKLTNVRAGTKITVYDSKDGSTGDDYCVTRVKKQVSEYIVGSFEQSVDNDTVRVEFYRNNGLDGKVSFIRIDEAF